MVHSQEVRGQAYAHWLSAAGVAGAHQAAAFAKLGRWYADFKADRPRARKCFQRGLGLNPLQAEAGQPHTLLSPPEGSLLCTPPSPRHPCLSPGVPLPPRMSTTNARYIVASLLHHCCIIGCQRKMQSLKLLLLLPPPAPLLLLLRLLCLLHSFFFFCCWLPEARLSSAFCLELSWLS